MASDARFLGSLRPPVVSVWPLGRIAAEQRRALPLINDPVAAGVAGRIRQRARQRVRRPAVFDVIRARIGDDLVARYVDQADSNPVVVTLGNALDTRPWRIADDRVEWHYVDNPESLAIRRRFLPEHARSTETACSPLDPEWLCRLPAGSNPFVVATGLLTERSADYARSLLATIADHCPSALVYFDTHAPGSGLRNSPTTWRVRPADISDFLQKVPGIRAAEVWTYADVHRERTRWYRCLAGLGPVRSWLDGALVLATAYRKTAENYRG